MYKLGNKSHRIILLIECPKFFRVTSILHLSTIINSIVIKFSLSKNLRREYSSETVTAIITLHKDGKLFMQIGDQLTLP